MPRLGHSRARMKIQESCEECRKRRDDRPQINLGVQYSDNNVERQKEKREREKKKKKKMDGKKE